MQIIPYHARLRQRLGGLPGLSADPIEYRKQYIEAYSTRVLPFIGGTRPPQGLNDADLPRGIKYLDPWAIAEFAQMGRYRTPVELAALLVEQSGDDENRTRSDSRKFAAWALMRLGAFYPLLTTRPYVPPETADVGRGSGGNQLRPAQEREDTGPKVTPLYDANAPILYGDDIYALYKQFVSLQKQTLAEWVDNVPNWAPWNEWPNRPEAPLALALLWATRVIGERYGIDGSRFLFDARTAQADGEKYAAALNAAFDAELRKGCAQASKYGGWGFGLVLGALVGAAVFIATGGTAAPAVIVGLTAFAAKSGAGAIGTGGGLFAADAIADLCGKDANEYRRRFIQTVWERLTPEGQFDFVKVVYAARFSVVLQSEDKNFDKIVGDLVAQINERKLKSAGDVFAFVVRPENDPNLQRALAAARGAVVEQTRKTFVDTVGCPGNPGLLELLATR